MRAQAQTFYLFYYACTCFFGIIEKNLHKDFKPAWLPFETMQNLVVQSYTRCNASSPAHPSQQQINNMTQYQFWGPNIDGQYPLQMKYAPQYKNTTFPNCFNTEFNQLTKNYLDNLNKSTMTVLIISLSAAAFVLLLTCCLCLLWGKSKKQTANNQHRLLPGSEDNNNGVNAAGEGYRYAAIPPTTVPPPI